MARLPGGAFLMGSDKDLLLEQFPQAGPGLRSMLFAETPRHQVTIPPFWIDRHEVTNAQFQRFVSVSPEWKKGRVEGNYLLHWNGDRFPEGQADLPVTFVTWNAALAYAEWSGKRLPTEAEWEFAARGGSAGATYPWGNEEPSPRLANYAAARKQAPVRVGSYPPNGFGLYDLAGNVWEFCLDEWQGGYPSGAVVQSEADLRRMRSSKAERRVIRGGSFAGGAFNLRVTARDSHRAGDPVAHVGFRCALSPQPAPPRV
jgi:formylglycine-generating enzyme required for sulfatase activity